MGGDDHLAGGQVEVHLADQLDDLPDGILVADVDEQELGAAINEIDVDTQPSAGLVVHLDDVGKQILPRQHGVRPCEETGSDQVHHSRQDRRFKEAGGRCCVRRFGHHLRTDVHYFQRNCLSLLPIRLLHAGALARTTNTARVEYSVSYQDPHGGSYPPRSTDYTGKSATSPCSFPATDRTSSPPRSCTRCNSARIGTCAGAWGGCTPGSSARWQSETPTKTIGRPRASGRSCRRLLDLERRRLCWQQLARHGEPVGARNASDPPASANRFDAG